MSEENKVPYTFSKDYIDKQLSSIRNMLDYRNYSLVSGLVNVSGDIYRPRRINRSVLRKALENPFFASNIDVLQQASTMLKATNGIYKRVLNYQAYMHTNDYMIYPKDVNKFKSSEKMEKSFIEASRYIEKYNIKSNAGWIKERVLEQGELYIYKIEDNKGMILQEIPNRFCKATSIEDGILKYAINLKAINDKNISSFPQEIQSIWVRFSRGIINDNDLIDKSYYELDNNAVAFNIDRFSPKGIPYYSTIFDDLMELEDMKDLKSQNAVIESIKLIHQKYPIDKDTGVALIDFDVITQFHNATKNTLPKGTSVTTNPLDVEAISLGDSNSKINGNVLQARDSVYDSAGVNAELFNGNKNSNEAISMGIISDSLIAEPINSMIESWINYDIKGKKFGSSEWSVRLLDTTRFNKDKKVQSAREEMAIGGFVLEFLATKGYTPLQAISMGKMESILEIGTWFKPKETSHTQSKNGRPDKSNSKSAETTVTPLQE